jgi:hypothetical protein
MIRYCDLSAGISVLKNKYQRRNTMPLKPGPKPKAKSTGKLDQRRRDNKSTPGNKPGLKPSKSSST